MNSHPPSTAGLENVEARVDDRFNDNINENGRIFRALCKDAEPHSIVALIPGTDTTRCFYIVRTDGSSTDVSYIKCIDGEKRRQLLRPALRKEILPQILQFKQAQFATGAQRWRAVSNDFGRGCLGGSSELDDIRAGYRTLDICWVRSTIV